MASYANMGVPNPNHIEMDEARAARASYMVKDKDYYVAPEGMEGMPGSGFMNADENKAAEGLSWNVHASARGLSKFGSYMA